MTKLNDEQLASPDAYSRRDLLDTIAGLKRQLADRDYLLDAYAKSDKGIALDAYVREKVDEAVAIALGAVLSQLTSGPYCRHDSRQIVERAISSNRAKLKETK